MTRPALLMLLLACHTRPPSAAGDPVVSEDLPVTQAVLYQNGIGYFERRGTAKDGLLTLRIRPDQIGDILKTLTVVSLSGGHAVSVALPVDKTRARQLADLPEQVRNGGGILAIAMAFRGARVVVDAKSGSAEGRLLGVERETQMSVLTDEGSIRVFALEEVKSMQVLDRSLELGLRKSLDAALGEASWKPVDLTVRLDSKEKRDLVVSYVVEMPTWKPAYRIILGSDKALLQGWAVVDNLSGEDWRNVKLSLASGTPLAFRYDLYAPRYRSRPDLTPPPESPTAAIPDAVDVEGSVASTPPPPPPPAPGAPYPSASSAARSKSMAKDSKKKSAAPRGRGRPSSADDMMEESMADAPAALTDKQIEQSFGAVVQSTQVGALYRYDINAPVSVRDRESALVSLINARVTGEEVWLFRVGKDSEHPYRAARFENDTGSVVERGPVAIYREGTFLGEALSGRVEVSGTTFLPFAIDGRVRLDLSEHTSEEGVRLVRIVNGYVVAEVKQVTRYTYDVTNGSTDEMTLWISRPKRTGWKIVNIDPKKVREQSGLNYVPVVLAKNGKTKLEVREETPSQRQVEANSDIGRRVLGLYVGNPEANPKLREKLKAAMASFDRISAIDDKISSLTQQKDTYAEREAEVRANFLALGKYGKNSSLRAQLEQSIAELEKKLDVLSREIVTLTIEKQKLRDETNAALRLLTL